MSSRRILAPLLLTAAVGVAACGSEATSHSDIDVEGLSLRYGAVTERAVDIDADGRNTTAAISGMNAFAIDLYRSTTRAADAQGVDAGNLVISPYSVTFALSMLMAGADGETADEMLDVLHAGAAGDGWNEGINAYDLTLDARTAGSPTTWAAANKVWTQRGLDLQPEYLDILAGVFGSPLADADFAADADAERTSINEWTAAQTGDLIPELFPTGAIDASTALVVVNAVALDAPWEFPFDPVQTVDVPFTLADGSSVRVPTMQYHEFLPSEVNERFEAVELPYGGGALSMVVIEPADLETYEATLTATSLAADIDAISEGGIHLSLPKWSARTQLELNDTLAGLGMPTAFSAGADFSKMVDGGGIWIDRVAHEAFIEVDEEGTRAAAATGGSMVASHGPTVQIDRPFLYVIRDRGAGTVLFIGRVLDPSVNPTG